MSPATPFDANLSDPSRFACPRCGFAVIVTSDRLRATFEDHVSDCARRPSAAVYRLLRREVKKARFLYGDEAAAEAANRVLAEAQP